MKYEIAIPSYKRANILKSKTLKLLQRHGVNNCLINIFVESKEMAEEYKELGMKHIKFTITNCKGIMETRNFLRTHYREQTKFDGVVYIDDDIEDIFEFLNKKMVEPIKDLKGFLDHAFKTTKYHNLNLWGVSALHNPFFMSDTVSTNLKYICGALCGEIIDRDKYEIHADVDHGEDFQFSMEHFLRDGGVVRFNNVGLKTKYFELEGGICGSLGGMKARQKQMDENMNYLADRYGAMCRVTNKKFGTDLRLNHFFKNLKVN